MSLSTIGQGLSGFGTILAIVNPTIGAIWSNDDTNRQERFLQARYYFGTFMIVVGTIIQMTSA